jgi:MFS family permease
MYLTQRGLEPLVTAPPPVPGLVLETSVRPRRLRPPRVGANVTFLGLTSLVTDVATEMVTAILPLFLTVRLGLTPLQFGAFDGTIQLITVAAAVVGAVSADRWRRHKEVAGAGYALSAACKLGLLFAGSWATAALWLSLDRTGKGVRTAPRDALISLSAPTSRVGAAFGLHRALDTGGALIGPVVAFWVLSRAPGAYDAVFVAAFCIAVVGLGLLGLFVRNRAPAGVADTTGPSLLSSTRRLLRRGDFRLVVLAAVVVSVATASDAFIFLAFRQASGLEQRWFPLLFVGSALVYLTAAVPLGRLADRVGPAAVFLGGQVALMAVYGTLLRPELGSAGLVLLLVGLGAFYAATDGVLVALASRVVPPELRATGLAFLAVALAAGRSVAALAFGAAWDRWGRDLAVTLFLVGLVVAALLAWRLLARLSLAAGRPGRSRGFRPVWHLVGPDGPPTRAAGIPVVGGRILVFAALSVVCLGAAGLYVGRASDRSDQAQELGAGTPPPEPAPGAREQGLSVLGAGSGERLLAVSTRPGPDFERLTSVALNGSDVREHPGDLKCARVDIVAGRGVCLVNDRTAQAQSAEVFDAATYRVLHRVPIEGLPSRVRIAPNGRVAAATSFVAGDSYAVDSFSTRTVFIDLDRGAVITDLERFDVRRNGRAFHPIDQNFWGVTFAADSDTFYATMRTGSHYYLVRGRLSGRTAEVLRDNVECPSLSPDGRLIVYKARVEHGFDAATWQLRVLDVASLADRPLAEPRSVDDQVAWLDDAHVAYGIPDGRQYSSNVDVWIARADGTRPPELLLPSASSPVLGR